MDWTNHLYLAEECSQGGRHSQGLPIFHLVLPGLMQLGFGLGVREGTGLGWVKLEG